MGKIQGSSCNLVEIDLLRQWPPLAQPHEAEPSTYRILVSPQELRPQAKWYGFNLTDAIPCFELPLQSGDELPVVELKVLLDGIYDRSGYGLVIDFIQVTPGNTDDRKPVDDLLKDLYGKVFADRGYVSKALAQRLFESYGIEFFAKPKRHRKNHLMRLTDKLLARKCALIETLIDPLKNISQIEHSRHRSSTNFMVNVVCGLIVYCHQPKKSSLNLDVALPQAD